MIALILIGKILKRNIIFIKPTVALFRGDTSNIHKQ